MKNTVFTELHKAAGAKMVEFAGFYMPIQYPKGIIAEHNIVRQKVGVFDVSHMGEFEVRGKDALKFVQKITVNDASKLTIGKVQYSAMPYENATLVDDLLVYKMEEDFYMLVVNGACVDKDWDWCKKNTEGMDLELTNLSDDFNLLAVQGPMSRATLQKLTDTDMTEETMPFYSFKLGTLAGVDMIISRTGYTGELGYELYFKGDEKTAKQIWDAVFDSGNEFGIEPVGLGCRDTLRLEKGYMLYGNDIDDTTNTLEAGLGWITKLDKGDFNGSAILKEVKANNPKRRLVGFTVDAKNFIARHGYKICIDGIEVGEVTSGNLSPSLEKPIGMGYVPWENKAIGTKIEIEARGRKFSAEIVSVPFLK